MAESNPWQLNITHNTGTWPYLKGRKFSIYEGKYYIRSICGYISTMVANLVTTSNRCFSFFGCFLGRNQDWWACLDEKYQAESLAYTSEEPRQNKRMDQGSMISLSPMASCPSSSSFQCFCGLDPLWIRLASWTIGCFWCTGGNWMGTIPCARSIQGSNLVNRNNYTAVMLSCFQDL